MGIGFGEIVFILFIALMLFGADKIPDIARTVGKAMAQFKNATNEIKSEIQKSAQTQELQQGLKQLTQQFEHEVTHIKHEVQKPLDDTKEGLPTDLIEGPIKRQR